MSYILFDYGAVADTQALLLRTAVQLQSALDSLSAELTGLEDAWQGADADAYRHLQQQWDTAAANLAAILRQLSAVLGTAAEAYRATEAHNARAFE